MLNIKYPFDEHNSHIKIKSIKNMLMKHTRNDSISLLYLIFPLVWTQKEYEYCRVAMLEIEFGLKGHYPPIRLKSH